MSEKLSEENRALIERAFPGYVPEQLRDAEGFLNALLNAARAEARPAVDREAVAWQPDFGECWRFVQMVGRLDHSGDEGYLFPDDEFADHDALDRLVGAAREIMSAPTSAALSPATSPGEGSSGAESAARIASDHAASETLRKSEKPVNTEPSGEWRHYTSMPKDGRWFYARTAEGQERLVHYADKYDRLPICDQGIVWSTFPVEWCEPTPTPDDAGGGDTQQENDHG